MSLEVFGDGGDQDPTRGEDTQLYHDLLDVRAKWSKWLIQWRNGLWCPDQEVQADKVSNELDEMLESLSGPL